MRTLYGMVVRKTKEFDAWLHAIRDPGIRLRIDSRLLRLYLYGHFGITRSVGEGVWEMKLDFGPGYRIYFSLVHDRMTLLLAGGTKQTQSKDIARAKELAKRADQESEHES